MCSNSAGQARGAVTLARVQTVIEICAETVTSQLLSNIGQH